jgi:hypothetical protein
MENVIYVEHGVATQYWYLHLCVPLCFSLKIMETEIPLDKTMIFAKTKIKTECDLVAQYVYLHA